jgi:hypothetical protein
MMARVTDHWSPRGPAAIRQIMRDALYSAAKEYIGKAAGGITGGTGGSAGFNNFQRRFTSSNTHRFVPLSNRPRFVVVQRKGDGKWVGFNAPGYADAKRARFGVKPILVASGAMVRDLREAASVRREGDRVVAVFRLSTIAGYHESGTRTMPRRDPVRPNADDIVAFRARAAQITRQLLVRWRAAGRI